MKRLFLLILFSLSLFSLLAGGSQEVPVDQPMPAVSAEDSFPRTVTDARGLEIFLDSRPSRIISLAPNITELIYALDRGDALVGRTDWCNYPAGVSEISSIGSLQEPSVEAILSLRPDLVIASTHAPMESLALLEEAGITTAIYYGPDSYDGVYQVIEGVGEILGAEAKAAALSSSMKSRTEAVLTAVAAMESKPRVYFVVGFGEGGDWTATGDTFIHQMLTMAGGDNIAADGSGWSYSLERLIQEDPDMIIINQGLGGVFKSSPIYSELRAAREDRVFELDENTIVRQGPRLIDGLELLSALFRS